ncbi:protein FAM193B isoform X1 [Phyllobates terribilis]
MPSLAQNILGEMPLWICQSCRKSVEEEERQAVPEQPLAVSLSHTSCKSQTCGGGSHSSSSSSSSSSSTSSSSSSSSSSCQGNSGDWDPSSFLSAHKLSGLWNSQHSNGSPGAGSAGDKGSGLYVSPEHVSKTSKLSSLKVCPYSPSGANTGTLPTSLNFCKSPKQFKTMCHRPLSPGESYHSSDLHHYSDPSAPPNSPTELSSQQPTSPHIPPPPHLSSSNSSAPFSETGLSSHTPPSKANVCATSGAHRGSHLTGSSPSLLKVNPPPPPLSACSHPCNGHCSGTNALQGTSPGTTNRDSTCRGHKFSNVSNCLATQPCEADEGLGEDEDSGSERSSCTSSSTNQRDGKFCDCCYCEFFGHNTPPPAPTSRNYPEMREKLRSRLTKRKEEVPQKRHSPGHQAVDHRDVDELLDFINSTEPKSTSGNKAAKRARHKLKKKAKALQEAGGQKSADLYCSNAEEADTPSSGEKLLQWPQLELERVNSFLTSRLEEIKNTIKDSIRASFSVYDLNLDVNDFPKKAAVLEQKNLLSHLNGSSDLQEIDLDLTPLTLSVSKGKEAKLSEEGNLSSQPAENGIVKRLSAVPNLSRMIWVQSQKNSELGQSPDKTSGSVPDKVLSSPENQRLQGQSVTGSRMKKSKKQSLQTRKCEFQSEEANTSAQGTKAQQRFLLEKNEDISRQGPDTVNCVHFRPEKDKNEPSGSERTDVKSTSGNKSKARRSRNKTDKPSILVDDVFLPKDLDGMEMDEIDREVEYFKRFCLDSAKQTRQKVAVNWTNFSLKKTTFSVAQ